MDQNAARCSQSRTGTESLLGYTKSQSRTPLSILCCECPGILSFSSHYLANYLVRSLLLYRMLFRCLAMEWYSAKFLVSLFAAFGAGQVVSKSALIALTMCRLISTARSCAKGCEVYLSLSATTIPNSQTLSTGSSTFVRLMQFLHYRD